MGYGDEEDDWGVPRSFGVAEEQRSGEAVRLHCTAGEDCTAGHVTGRDWSNAIANWCAVGGSGVAADVDEDKEYDELTGEFCLYFFIQGKQKT